MTLTDAELDNLIKLSASDYNFQQAVEIAKNCDKEWLLNVAKKLYQKYDDLKFDWSDPYCSSLTEHYYKEAEKNFQRFISLLFFVCYNDNHLEGFLLKIIITEIDFVQKIKSQAISNNIKINVLYGQEKS